MESKVDQFTRGFFWCGYGVFLLASIPHIAAYFRHFDPSAKGAEDLFWWIIAYALAVVIDLSDVLISIAVMRAMARGETFKQLWSFWLFIVFIMALSWFFNWQYNVVNETASFAAVDSTLILNWITVGTINPIIGSAFQVLLLVYTAMAHKFAHKPVEKTAAQLEAQANEMAEKDTQLARILALKKTQKQRQREAFFEELKQARDGAFQVVKGEAKPTIEPMQNGGMESGKTLQTEGSKTREVPMNSKSQNDLHTEPTEGPMDTVKTGNDAAVKSMNDTGSHTTGSGAAGSQNGTTSPSNTDLSQVVKRYPKVQSEWLAQERKSVTIDEIVEVTKHSKRRLLAQVGKAFKTTPRNPEKILIGSVLEWLKTAPIPEQNAGLASAFPTEKTGGSGQGNGYQKQTVKLADLVEVQP